MKNKKILVLGYFGYRTNQLDGQTVKTRAIYELLRKRYNGEVAFADTQEFRQSFKSITLFLRNLAKCENLIWLPAHNNLKYLFPIIWIYSKIFKTEIIYIVIGGWLSKFLRNLPFHRRNLKKIKTILVENEATIKELYEQHNYQNLEVIPNFREGLPSLKIRELDGKLKIVFMARINKQKGLDTIKELSRVLPENTSIDFYGPIFNEDSVYFNTMLNCKSLKYCGCLQPNEIVDVLRTYDCLILPTHYYTEGFPGSILDAYRSGIPVIVTNWKHANEFVTNGVSGFIADFTNPLPDIVSAVNKLLNDPLLLNMMKKNAYNEATKYTEDVAWETLSKYL